ncbi:MAG: tRNA pseudouridine(55) synthase TruB [Holosporales bacterium]|nr:tRNA pseudouridine(55) synthase TruB [Holosporales bacterium]
MDGFIVLDKPEGKSSFFIANRCRKILGARKVGHLGTLDPFATGLLTIAVNAGTKAIPYVSINQKCYEFEIKFGEKTDTGDKTGKVIAAVYTIPEYDEVMSILPKFLGKIQQKPHQFSAIKIKGQRAYQIARKGLNPNIESRSVTIFNLHLLARITDNIFKLEATVSPGTYVRSLAEDIATSLRTVGHVISLRRILDGKFGLDDAITIDRLEEKKENIEDVLISLEEVLCDIPTYFVSDREASDLAFGRSVAWEAEIESRSGVCLASAKSGKLWIAEVRSAGGVSILAPRRVLIGV